MINESEFTDEYVLKLQEELEYEQHCNEQLRNKITNLENKIKRLEEDNKYKIVLDKIKNYLEKQVQIYGGGGLAQEQLENFNELLEEIE